MKKENNFIKILSGIFLFLVIIFALYVIWNFFKNLKIIIGIIILSFGILSLIWTLIANYSLSKKSMLRMYTNIFLTCSIAVLGFTITRLISSFISIPKLIYVEFFFIFATFFFFVLASYYIYSLGKEFGFQQESDDIGKRLKEKVIKKKSMRRRKN